MQEVTVLFGKPGAGKGTWLDEVLTQRQEHFEYLTASSMLKEAIRNKTEAGMIAKSFMDAGGLVPDEIVNDIVIPRIKSAKKHVLLDGYPRTVAQAKVMLEAGIYPVRVLHLYVKNEIVLLRARDRIVCRDCSTPYTTNAYKRPKVDGICDKCGGELIKRKDDEEAIVQNRLKEYKSKTYPVLDLLKEAGVDVFTIDNSNGQASDKKFVDAVFG